MPTDARAVRVFHAEDRETAAKLAQETADALEKLGMPGLTIVVRDLTVLEGEAAHGDTRAVAGIAGERPRLSQPNDALQRCDALRPAVGCDRQCYWRRRDLA